MKELSQTRWSLVLAARQGNEEAIRTFTEKYRPTVVSFIGRRGLKSEAEDIAQEVLIGLFHKGGLKRVDPEHGRFRSWLLVVTRHMISMHLKHRGAQKRGGQADITSLEDIDVAESQEDEEFDREWVANLLELALARLAQEYPNYHASVKLFLLEERSYEQIAEQLGRSRTDVKNYIYRGKRKLIAFLRDEVRGYSTSRRDYEEELAYLARFLPGA